MVLGVGPLLRLTHINGAHLQHRRPTLLELKAFVLLATMRLLVLRPPPTLFRVLMMAILLRQRLRLPTPLTQEADQLQHFRRLLRP